MTSVFDLKAKSIALTILIFFLYGVNIVFGISWALQRLGDLGGDIVQQTVVKEKPKSDVTLPAVKEQPRRIEAPPVAKRISVEILNGCNIEGAAATLRDHLIGSKFDVVDFKNADSFDYPKTYVIDRVHMDRRNAFQVARAIGVRSEQVLPQISLQRKLDVTIIIGTDYKKYKVFDSIP